MNMERDAGLPLPEDRRVFAARLSTEPDPKLAVDRAVGELRESLPDADLVVVLVAGFAPDAVAGPLEKLRNWWGDGVQVAGATVAGVLHNGREFEEGPAVLAWGARLKTDGIRVGHVEFSRAGTGGTFTAQRGWPLPGAPDDGVLILLADPWSFPVDLLTTRMHDDGSGTVIVGGMLSAGHGPRENLLLGNDRCHDSGCIFIRIPRQVPHSVLVSQGCRPVGDPMVVTAAERNEIHGLGGRPALERLQEMFRELPASDQALVNQGLLLGIATTEFRDHFGYGDFLVRHVMGVGEESRAIVVGDYVRVGKTVQFHVRDHHSASADLTRQIAIARESLRPRDVGGALVFTCNGRGQHLFPGPNHDAAAFAATGPEVAVGGFFAAGEIGPVGSQSFVHGHTATAVLFGSPAVE